jgi:hypothetical protein
VRDEDLAGVHLYNSNPLNVQESVWMFIDSLNVDLTNIAYLQCLEVEDVNVGHLDVDCLNEN